MINKINEVFEAFNVAGDDRYRINARLKNGNIDSRVVMEAKWLFWLLEAFHNWKKDGCYHGNFAADVLITYNRRRKYFDDLRERLNNEALFEKHLLIHNILRIYRQKFLPAYEEWQNEKKSS
jgi:hypothetical protein